MRLFSSRNETIQGVQWKLVISCLLTSPKFDFGEVEIAMFQVVSSHWNLIFFLLTSPNSDLCEVVKAMFHVLACDFELIFRLLIISKCDFVEVEETFFQGHAWHFQPIFASKFYFGEVGKLIFQVLTRLRGLIFFHLTSPKCDLGLIKRQKMTFKCHSTT